MASVVAGQMTVDPKQKTINKPRNSDRSLYLRAVLDVVSLVEAEVTQVGAWRTLAGLAVHGQVAEVVRKVRHASERRRADGLGIRAVKGVLQHNHNNNTSVF